MPFSVAPQIFSVSAVLSLSSLNTEDAEKGGELGKKRRK